jgi:hypothetical protein
MGGGNRDVVIGAPRPADIATELARAAPAP